MKEEKNTLRPHLFVSVLPPTFWSLILILQFSLPFFKSLPSTRSESIRTPLKSDHLRIPMPSSYFPIYPGPGLNYKTKEKTFPELRKILIDFPRNLIVIHTLQLGFSDLYQLVHMLIGKGQGHRRMKLS